MAEPGSRLLRFLAVGLSNTALSYLVFRVGLTLLDSAFLAQALSYAAGIVWSFVLNSRWTFRQDRLSGGRFVRFVTVQFALLAGSSAALGGLVDRLGLPATACWIAVMVLVTVANYLATSRWVFGAGPRPGDSAG